MSAKEEVQFYFDDFETIHVRIVVGETTRERAVVIDVTLTDGREISLFLDAGTSIQLSEQLADAGNKCLTANCAQAGVLTNVVEVVNRPIN